MFSLRHGLGVAFLVLLFLFSRAADGEQNTNKTKITTPIKVYPIKIPGLLEMANVLDRQGVVGIQRGSYLYLKISDRYTSDLYPILKDNLPFIMRINLKPDQNQLGAHITLVSYKKISPEVARRIKPFLGRSFSFQPEKMQVIFLRKKTRFGVEERAWFVLAVKAPKLEHDWNKVMPKEFWLRGLHVSIGLDG